MKKNLSKTMRGTETRKQRYCQLFEYWKKNHYSHRNILSRSGGEKGLRGSGAGTLVVPLGGTRRVGGLLGVAGRLSGTVSPFRAEQGTSL